MSSKQLTAKVRLDVTQAEKKIKLLEKRINKLNTLVNKQDVATNGLSKGFNKAANSASKFDKNVRKSANSVGFLTKKVKLLANAYLGVMGAKAVINTSDLITSAENKLNNIPGGNAQKTQDTMDKTYAAAQRSRGDYGAMLSNVSKTMTLASGAFQDNVDNAIKFQEIMSKAYTVGGASAAEQSSSMYQLVQALGSGVLQGDELRSVREGAAYAYKEIEKFAQGIYGAEKSLKDLASEGKITSDIVVAAIMNAEDSINKAFDNTDRTFAQVGTNLKNTAVKAFEPVLQMLNAALNSDFGNAVINGIGNAIIIVANSVRYLFDLIQRAYQFVSDNWSVISKIIMTIGAVIAIALLPKLIAQIKFLVWAAWYYAYLAGVAVASAFKTAGAWLVANWQLALVLVILAAIVIAIIWVSDSFVDACGIIVGTLHGVWAVIKAVATNIGIAFSNAWNSAKSTFWSFIAACFDGLKSLEPAINAVAKAFGAEGFTVSGVVDYASKKANSYTQKEYVSVGDAWKEAYKKGYDKGSGWGQNVMDKMDEFKNKLGLDSLLKNPLDQQYSVGGNYDPGKALDGINDNTGKIADSMELTKEDLDYLRRVADMEWKKEFTTAEIKIEMNNNNQINGDGDLDGIVTRLADKLYEEMNVVANGVYAY